MPICWGLAVLLCLLISMATQSLCFPSGVTDLYTPEIACLCGEQHVDALLSGCTARTAVSRAGVLLMPTASEGSGLCRLTEVQAPLLKWALFLSCCHRSLRICLAPVAVLATPASACITYIKNLKHQTTPLLIAFCPLQATPKCRAPLTPPL